MHGLENVHDSRKCKQHSNQQMSPQLDAKFRCFCVVFLVRSMSSLLVAVCEVGQLLLNFSGGSRSKQKQQIDPSAARGSLVE